MIPQLQLAIVWGIILFLAGVGSVCTSWLAEDIIRTYWGWLAGRVAWILCVGVTLPMFIGAFCKKFGI